MTPLRDWSTANLLWLGVLGLVLGGTMISGIQAVWLDPLPLAEWPDEAAREHPHSTPVETPQARAVLAAVAANPMRPDRRRPAGRYGRLRSDEAEPAPPAPVPAFRIVGIVRSRSGPDLAAIAADHASARLVRLGGEIEGFRLNRVRADSVLLSRPDTAIALPVPGPRYIGGGS